MIKESLDKNKMPFYDFSNLRGINTANHFYDDSHLNQAGVELFNAALIQQLQHDKLLELHAGN